MRRFGTFAAILAAFTLFGGVAAAPAYAQDRPANDFEQALFDAHNAERRSAGVPAFSWSERLANDAYNWAQQLARQGSLTHASREQRGQAGENLWMGPAERFSAQTIFGTFLAEKRHFTNGVFPNVSKTGRWRDVGHYTQVIWRGSREMGCAAVRNERDEFLVCRYWPAGNWHGQSAL